MNAIIVLLVHKEKNAKKNTHVQRIRLVLIYRIGLELEREKKPSTVKAIFLVRHNRRESKGDFSLKIVSSCQLEYNLSKYFEWRRE